ncbi:hypothetical protein BDA96_01G206600 [Sorghum bicolor]|uniref:Ubiquitin-like protease family profile domain-containing protein n=2 Tax=Sorghum bicolor TaxID=4558 RepID=C5WVE6_SORBI|nr:uncharacterized protein LOC8065853 [Sorghum bicolor]EER93939.2 hypothetical protein SORBI_3001G195600 [Sorghum bicolor]KAG0548893.1 hypothetical protein BDA96_01G206600 [Sorghum bicolor]|eukprot:XP_021319967.1 uncharacterized protein LOC8065853 [Sorghum bicolor]
MASKRNFSRVVEGTNRGDHCQSEVESGLLSTANINMLEQFLVFCKSKKMNEHNVAPKGINGGPNDGAKVHGESNSFRDKLNMYFGEFLPANVVDDLCKLVHENSYGKCSFCLMPTESLVLSVLQILLDAAKTADQMKEKNGAAPVVENNHAVCNDNSVPSILRDNRRSSSVKEQSNRRIVEGNFEVRKPIGDPKNDGTTVAHAQNSIASRGPSLFADDNSLRNPYLILDTPIVLHHGKFKADEFTSVPANVATMNKKGRIESPKPLPDVEVLGVSRFKDRCMQLGKLNDELYNRRNVSSMAACPTINLTGGIPEGRRFLITDEEKAYYKIICGLAYSQWSCFKAVEFSKTSVTYSSLGQSVEPRGKVDNFFVACMCRKFLEDEHPRQSKKHYFYPKVGGCLYTYNCIYDMDTVRNCFLGANSAHKLHLSDKLCFPIIIEKHWFVFIVDLKNKLFVFLDSYFSDNHNFQVRARTKLINAFKDSWHQYAEGNVDVDTFSVFYPPVSKQNNVVDCSVFALKFMELWDRNVDLRDLLDHSDIPDIRVKLGIDLFFSKGNCIDKSLVMNLYKQGVDPRVCN